MATNRSYENTPKATASKGLRNAREKNKKNFFLTVRIVLKYCILCYKKLKTYYI